MKTLSSEAAEIARQVAELLNENFGVVEVVGYRFWAIWKRVDDPECNHGLRGTIGSVVAFKKKNGELCVYLIPVGVNLDDNALNGDGSALKKVFLITNDQEHGKIFIPNNVGAGRAYEVELVIEPP